MPRTEMMPLFARLSAPSRSGSSSAPPAAGDSGDQRRGDLADGARIRHVIDSGLARISRYSVRSKVQRLPWSAVSKASADQRKGRCGREAEGICIRLYSEEDFAAREDFTPPEILRTNLASVMLRMATLGLRRSGEFPVSRSAGHAADQ